MGTGWPSFGTGSRVSNSGGRPWRPALGSGPLGPLSHVLPSADSSYSVRTAAWRESSILSVFLAALPALQPLEPHASPDGSPAAAAALERQDEVDSEGLGDALERIEGDPVEAALDAGDRGVAGPCPFRQLLLRELPSGPMLPDDTSQLLELTSSALLVPLGPRCGPMRPRSGGAGRGHRLPSVQVGPYHVMNRPGFLGGSNS